MESVELDNTPIIKNLPPAPFKDGEILQKDTKAAAPEQGKGASALEELDILLQDSPSSAENQSVKCTLCSLSSLY